jgi:hypothetical protein
MHRREREGWMRQRQARWLSRWLQQSRRWGI